MGQGWAILDTGAGASGSRPVSFASSRTTVERDGNTTTFREQLAVASTNGRGTTTNVHTTATTTTTQPPREAAPPIPTPSPAVPTASTPPQTPCAPPRPQCDRAPATRPTYGPPSRGDRSRDQIGTLDDLRNVVARMLEELQRLQREYQHNDGWMRGRHIGGGLDVQIGRGGRPIPHPLHAATPPSTATPPPAAAPAASTPPPATPPPAPACAEPPPSYLWYHIRDAALTRFNGEMVGFQGAEATQVAQAVDGVKLNDGMHRLYGLLGQVADYQLSGNDLSADQLHAIADEADAIFAEAVRTPTTADDAGDYSPTTRDGVFDPNLGMRSTRSIVVEASITAATDVATEPAAA